MTARCKAVFFSESPDKTEAILPLLKERGIDTELARDFQEVKSTIERDDSNLVILDLRSNDGQTPPSIPVTPADIAGSNHTMLVLSDQVDATLSAFSDPKSKCQIITGPAIEEHVVARVETISRLHTMTEEITRRHRVASRFNGKDDELNPLSDISTHKATILVVGDPSPDFSLIESALAENDNLLIGAFSVEMAYEYMLRQDFDLVIINADGDIEKYTGLMENMRRNARLYNVPTILITSDEKGDTAVDLYRAGANSVILKPIRTLDLQQQVEMLIFENRYHTALTGLYTGEFSEVTRDGLTGLYSHGFLMDHLAELIKDCERTNTPLTVGFIDVFKMADINAEFGYSGGDTLLRQAGNVIGRLFRGEDLCARYSGEEFIAVLPRTTVENALIPLKRIAGTINSTEFYLPGAEASVHIYLTLGATDLVPGDTPKSIIDRARKSVVG